MELSLNKSEKRLAPKFSLFTLLVIILITVDIYGQRQMEFLTRGLVAVKSDDGVFLSWRIFATDSSNISFNIYRNGSKINAQAISSLSNYIDSFGTTESIYYLETLYGPTKTEISTPVMVWGNNYLDIPLQPPPSGKTPPYTVTNNGVTESYPDGQDYSYTPNDASIGDLDGDGEFEIILKFYPTNARDNSQGGITGNVFLDAYKMDGTLLWRVNLGVNIRAGAHYTQFMVYDLNSDGHAEVACKTAPGTIDGTGKYLSDGPAANDNDSADYRTTGSWPGFIIDGPEYLTIFDGMTGAEITTVDYVPDRYPTDEWGNSRDNTNRVDRFLACVAYFDTIPSLVMCRGYYGRSVLAAWDFDGTELTQRWVFDTDPDYTEYGGQGAHSLSVGDVDNDDMDEIMYGAMAIDHDGSPLYNTQFLHGDATHLSDFIPSNPGLEFYMPSESAGFTHDGVTNPLVHIRDAATGEVIVRIDGDGDNGRAMIGDITDAHAGCEFWSARDGSVRNSSGTAISSNRPPMNFASWWDGDLLREMLDGNTISKWGDGNSTVLLDASDCSSNNSSKATPSLSGDIIGDWREEVIFRTSDNQNLRLFTTTTPTDYGIYTLLQDPQYRLALTWQNVGYNQPPHPSFFIGADMDTPPVPDIKIIDLSDNPIVKIVTPKQGYELGLGLDLDIIVRAIGISDTNQNIYISANGSPIDTINAPPYFTSIPNLTTGEYSLVASAYDKKGNLVESQPIKITVDQGYPHVSLSEPIANTAFLPEDSITFTADAYDTDGIIDSVSFLINNVRSFVLTEEPYTKKIENPGVGIHSVKAIAYDDSLFSTESESVDFGVGLAYTLQEDEIGFCNFGNGSGTIDSNHEGYTGSGFANTANAEGEQIDWAVEFPETGTYKFVWRYAIWGDGRPANLLINDTVVSAVEFENTGAWTTWYTTFVYADIEKGVNKVSLEATSSSGLVNIDYLEIVSFYPGEILGMDCDSLIPSNDATLSYLRVTEANLNPSFNSNTFSYSVDLIEGTTEINIIANPTDPNASVNGVGTVAINSSSDSVNIAVTSRDGTVTREYTITYGFVTSVNELASHQLKIYPIPTQNYVYVLLNGLNKNIRNIEIIKIDGNTIKTINEIEGDLIKIDLTGIQNGIYFMKVNTYEKSYVRKFTVYK